MNHSVPFLVDVSIKFPLLSMNLKELLAEKKRKDEEVKDERKYHEE